MPQTPNNPQRYRGFVLTTAGLQKLHTRVKQLEAQTRLRQSSRAIAERVQLSEPDGIHPITVRKILDGQSGVDKRSIQVVFQVLQLQLEEGDYVHAGLCQQSAEVQPSTAIPVATVPLSAHQAWSSAVHEPTFYGRANELTQLSQAILVEDYQLVQILGMAGVGKTALATMLAKTIHPEFELVRWKSLHHAPTIEMVLKSLLQSLIQKANESIELPGQAEALMELLIEQFQNRRCLLVFDHFNSVLCSKQYAGYCRQGYEAYDELLKVVAEVSHQSCLIITSREKPKMIGIGEGSIRSLYLNGLLTAECQQVLNTYDGLVRSIDDLCFLTEHCNGNPLVLKMVVNHIQDYFGGDISEYIKYLKPGRSLFSNLRDLLKQQFDRLSPLEQEFVHQLALYQEPISISQFYEDVMLPINQQCLLDVLESLSQRSLLHRQENYFSLDLMMSTYVNECFVEQRDISSVKPKLKIVSNNPKYRFRLGSQGK